MNIQNPATRRYVYGIAIAAIPLLVILGVITADQSQVYLNLAAAVLGLGTASLALPNTPKASGDPEAAIDDTFSVSDAEVVETGFIGDDYKAE
jgi:hypothetical protein